MVTQEDKESVQQFLVSSESERFRYELNEFDILHHRRLMLPLYPRVTRNQIEEDRRWEEENLTTIKDLRLFILLIDSGQLHLGRTTTETREQIWERITPPHREVAVHQEARIARGYTFTLRESGIRAAVVKGTIESESGREIVRLLENHGFVVT